MIKISHTQLDALAQDGVQALAPRIGAWLNEVSSAWRSADPAQRQDALPRMLDLAKASGMQSERDYAVFAWICVSLGSNWLDRLSKPDVQSMLRSPEWEPESKLMRLDETFKLTEAGKQGGASR